MRLCVGDNVFFFNGQHGEFLGEIELIQKTSMLIYIKTQIRMQMSDPDIWLLFAPIKKSGVNFIAEKATELGVVKLLPVLTEHTNTQRVNLNRLRSIAIEAAEQCQRLTVPDLSEPKTLHEVLEDWNPSRRLLVMDETLAMQDVPEEEVFSFSKLINKEKEMPCDAILIGPEGGFSSSELNRLSRHTFVKKITLGQRILRAETAATVALGLWNELIEYRK
jgi:16S rRNA (uracil1498-N3)-methyltransferase